MPFRSPHEVRIGGPPRANLKAIYSLWEGEGCLLCTFQSVLPSSSRASMSARPQLCIVILYRRQRSEAEIELGILTDPSSMLLLTPCIPAP
jgi:hypothetical protein